ncbi:MAG: rhodanese-like domain-containing protein [Pyrinomonadaceae bacterium]
MSNAAAKVEARTISTEELSERIAAGERFEFWNVLTAEYYTGELIARSRYVPLDRIGREVIGSKIPKDAEIVVYCAGPECPQSAAAAEKLTTLGYTRVKAYEGGLEEWKAAGHKTVTAGAEERAAASCAC